MAKKRGPFSALINLAVWVTGVLVSLAVGFGMIGQGGVPVLSVPGIPAILTIIAGWIVVVLTLLSVVLAILEKLR